ncbi:MAG: hypothetical protein AB8F78_16420 [Saprospiraceae bacterium]
MKFLYLFVATLVFCSSSCEVDPIIDTPEEEAARILANTPTELPPITSTGENTMGAYIIPQPGSELHRLAGQDTILFVASGVERIDPIGASSTDCNAFQNFRFESQEYTAISGRWCDRPEIGDDRFMRLLFGFYDSGAVILRFRYEHSAGMSSQTLRYGGADTLDLSVLGLQNNLDERICFAQFSGTLYNIENNQDSALCKAGSFDARYGITP